MKRGLKDSLRKARRSFLQVAIRFVVACIIVLMSSKVSFAKNVILCGLTKCDIDIYNCVERNQTYGIKNYFCEEKTKPLKPNESIITKAEQVEYYKNLTANEIKIKFNNADFAPIMKKSITERQKTEIKDIKYSNGYQESLARIKLCDPVRGQKIESYLKDLEDINKQTEREWNGLVSRYTPEGRQKEITDLLREISRNIGEGESNICSKDDIKIINNETAKIATDITQKWHDNAVELGNKSAAENRKEELAEIKENAKLTECPSVADVKAKHFAGCWACLVIEKMTSAFLNAANKGLKVSRKAGVVLLIIGSGIWLVMWGLKNVSSFTEVQLGNILNDLIKFLFKVAIAYWFIFYSQTAISKYFIKPIMSVGALVGQQFWDAVIKQFVEDWEDNAEPVEDLQSLVREAEKENKELIEKNQSTSLVVSEEDQELLQQAKELELHDNEKADIPSFVIPGVSGYVTSYPGCRVPPKTAKGYGSSSHMGLDVGGNNMKPIKAIGGGRITYSGDASSGWGLKAMITTTHKGVTWTHLYGHMNPQTYQAFKSKLSGREVVRGQQIGNVGTTGNSSGPHLHLEVQVNGKIGGYNYNQTYLDPISLGQGKIVPRAFDYNEGTKTFTFNKKKCNGKAEPLPNTGIALRQKLPDEGLATNGKAGIDLSTTYTDSGDYLGASPVGGDYSSLIVEIPEVNYTGPTNIMPKSVMNSILGATRAITNTTAGVAVLGDVIMCYAGMENGGAWKDGIIHKNWLNVPMWLSGLIILCLGYLLTMTIGYYLIDISFKIGFAVLAMPLVMGLWPFDIMKNKLYGVISIIAKAAATFAFLALTTAFGVALVDSAFDQGGLEELYSAMDYLADSGVDTSSPKFKEMRSYVAREIQFSSTKFILIAFSLWYFFKLIQKTSSDLVNKFFPDQIFGDSSPMHSGATMATAYAKKMAMKYSGANWIRDAVSHQAGRLVHGGLKKTGSAVRHPVRTAKAVANAPKKAFKATVNAPKKAFNKVKGWISKLRGKGGAS